MICTWGLSTGVEISLATRDFESRWGGCIWGLICSEAATGSSNPEAWYRRSPIERFSWAWLNNFRSNSLATRRLTNWSNSMSRSLNWRGLKSKIDSVPNRSFAAVIMGTPKYAWIPWTRHSDDRANCGCWWQLVTLKLCVQMVRSWKYSNPANMCKLGWCGSWINCSNPAIEPIWYPDPAIAVRMATGASVRRTACAVASVNIGIGDCSMLNSVTSGEEWSDVDLATWLLGLISRSWSELSMGQLPAVG